MATRRDDIIKKIMQRVVKTEDGCWIWQGPTSGDGRGGGYPRMNLDGQTVAVHRVIFTCFFGFIPGKKQIDHTCRNRLCCNPEHLEMVTHKKNQLRRDLANRQARTQSISP
ncbi:HNH endonuclease signature motif containing protein [Cohaesibacter sp. ES.047]|uniref:HNH endonuclease signature motif containing protein n=1 Tax=Cohaesibacter sp. ES.047 TaxID=1798205 RepID=UPI0015607E5F|nr:HNH endonuclease signature motif containing protein [Cohaesibacter sp. ES.047]